MIPRAFHSPNQLPHNGLCLWFIGNRMGRSPLTLCPVSGILPVESPWFPAGLWLQHPMAKHVLRTHYTFLHFPPRSERGIFRWQSLMATT